MVNSRLLYTVRIPRKFIKGNKLLIESGIVRDTVVVLAEEIRGVK